MAPKKETIHVAEVVKTGDKLVLPESWDAATAIRFLEQLKAAEETETQVVGKFPTNPFEGAYALEKAIQKVFGMVTQVKTPGFFQDTPPVRLSIRVSTTEELSVPWGRIALPIKDGGYVETSYERTPRGLHFVAVFTVKGKWVKQAQEAVAETNRILGKDMLLKGRVFTIRFKRPDGKYIEPMPEIAPFKTVTDRPIFSADVDHAIDAYILAPIQYKAAIDASKVPFKRGILAGGPYGTGKTMLAAYVAGIAAQHGVTFIYLADSAEITDGLLLAKQYAPAVVFAEDIDRVAGGEDRTESVNSVINQLDGIDTKGAEIITILTSNHAERLNKAMIRPGRIDLGLALMPPDAPTATRLVVHYLAGLAADVSFEKVGEYLKGRIPAAIREVVERAKLATIARSGGQPVKAKTITPEDVVVAAAQLKNEELLFKGSPMDLRSDVEKAADRLGGHLRIAASGGHDMPRVLQELPELDDASASLTLLTSGEANHARD